MSFNLRSGSVPDGSITNAKLANNAVDSSKLADNSVVNAKLASNAVDSAKLADNAVVNAKIASNAVDGAKLASNSVDTTKVTGDLTTTLFLGSEISLPLVGTVETSVADFNFNIAANNAENWKKFSYSLSLASSVGTNTASVKMYIDGVQFGTTKTTVSTTPVILNDTDVDISSLTAGSHHFEVKLVNTGVSDTATLSQINVYFNKK